MKDVAIGCVSAILGLCLGIALTVGFFSVGIRSAVETPVPAPSGSRRAVTVTVTASYLNAQIQQTVKQGGLVRSVTFSFVAPNVVNAALVVDVSIAGRTIPVNANVAMRMTARSGRIGLTVDRIDVEGVTVPATYSAQMGESVRAQMEDQLNRALQRALAGLSLRLVSVSVTPVEVTLQFEQ